MRRGNAQDYAYKCIKEEILQLRLRPGSRIHANEVAKNFNLSRTPIREALSRLEQEGLITRTSGWGYSVRSFDLQDIMDLFKLREILEVEAGLEALRNLNNKLVSKLRALQERAESLCVAGKVHEFRLLNRQFHLSIGLATHNELLNRMLLMLNDRILIVGSMHIERRKHRMSEIAKENRKIFEAIVSGNPSSVKSAILRHIRNSKIGLMR